MSDFVEQLREVAAASLLPESGELTVPGLAEPVEILRDHWGVPYISAASLDDLWFAQGFVTAGERLFQMDLLLRAASGRLSEVFADRTLADDRFARTIGFSRTRGEARGRMGRRLARDARAGSARGARRGSAQMPAPPVEYSLLDMAPSLPTDDAGAWAAAFVYLAWGLSGNWDQELLRTAIAERLGPDEVGVLLPPLPADPPPSRRARSAGRLLDELPAPEGRRVERLGGGGLAHGDRQATARERPAPARRAARRVDRDAPARSRVRGARRGAHVLARRSCSARPRITRGASRT